MDADFDTDQFDAAETFKVKTLPTVIVFENGEEVSRTESSYAEDLAELLNPYS